MTAAADAANAGAERRPWLTALAIGVTATAMWLLSRPFTFKETDGQVYAFLALASRAPGVLGQDLFIRFGSQDSFSVFSAIYGGMVAWVGLTAATMALLLVGAALWLWACWRLLNAMLDGPRAQIGLIALASLHVAYGGFSSLTLGEGFLTSRIFAEAFVVLGLAELARGHWARSAPAFLLGVAVHPLMGLAGLAVALVGEAWAKRWLWALAAGGGVLVVGLAACGVAPFDRLFVEMKGPWLEATRHRNGFVFVSNWSAKEWAALISQSAAVGLAATRTDGWSRRFLFATLACAAGGVLASWLGADLMHIALLVQMQVWRFTWPLAWASVPAVLLLVPATRDPVRWVIPALFAASLLPGQGWPAAGLAAMALVGGLLGRPIEPRFARLLLVVVAVSASLYLLEMVAFYVLSWPSFQREHYTDYLTIDAQKALSWIIAPPAIWLIYRRPRTGLVVAVALLLIGAGLWDRRAPWQRYLMDGRPPVATAGPVLWGGDAAPSWFLLRAPAYVSIQQGAGLLFSSRTAAVWEARVPVTQGIVAATTWSAHEPMQNCANSDPVLTSQDIQRMCHAPDGPHAIVLRRPVANLAGVTFDTPADETVPCRVGQDLRILHRHRFYFYECQK